MENYGSLLGIVEESSNNVQEVKAFWNKKSKDMGICEYS